MFNWVCCLAFLRRLQEMPMRICYCDQTTRVCHRLLGLSSSELHNTANCPLSIVTDFGVHVWG